MCSALGDQFSSFNDELIDLTNITSNANCATLLLSECSAQSSFAVFVTKLAASKRFAFKVFYHNDFVEYTPVDDQFSATIKINGNQTASVADSSVKVSGIT